jgi:peptide deformylase
VKDIDNGMQLLVAAYQRRIEDKDAKECIRQSGIEPIFEEQTPEVPPLQEITEDVLNCCADMLVFARHCPYMNLAGLAANQLGISGKRISLNVCFINRGWRAGWLAALNPGIVSETGVSKNSSEGCLTWPKKKILAIRRESVVVSYLGLEGTPREESVEGFEAVVWQHEINHLKGIPEHVMDPDKKQKPNAPCLCGSGRKFKRCCGK